MPTREVIEKELKAYEHEKTQLDFLLLARNFKCTVTCAVTDSFGDTFTVNLSDLPNYPLYIEKQVKQMLKDSATKYGELIEDIKAITNIA